MSTTRLVLMKLHRRYSCPCPYHEGI